MKPSTNRKKKSLHKASLKFFVKWLQSENEALLEQMYNFYTFSWTVVLFRIRAFPIRKKKTLLHFCTLLWLGSTQGMRAANSFLRMSFGTHPCWFPQPTRSKRRRKKKKRRKISLCQSAWGPLPTQLLSRCDRLPQNEQAELFVFPGDDALTSALWEKKKAENRGLVTNCINNTSDMKKQ